jgi:hypothetical protein
MMNSKESLFNQHLFIALTFLGLHITLGHRISLLQSFLHLLDPSIKYVNTGIKLGFIKLVWSISFLLNIIFKLIIQQYGNRLPELFHRYWPRIAQTVALCRGQTLFRLAINSLGFSASQVGQYSRKYIIAECLRHRNP